MKQVCLLCERTSPDSNLYCQETYCPAEMSPNILDYGEWLGDIEIVRPIIILRTAVLYEATHQKQKVLLKVAHPGPENKERLKREAELLRAFQSGRTQPPYLPTLLPPYANTTLETDAYGKAMLKGHLLYFCIFDHFDGEPLRDVLMKNPQLWINHVGWLMISVATAVSFLHSQGIFHYSLSPDVILVHFDDDPNVPRVVLFDLGLASDSQNLNVNWYPSLTPPAYTAPELIGSRGIRPDHKTDVYGLGLTLYELLVGEPPYPYRLQSDMEVYRDVQRSRRIRMNRVEDVRSVAAVALQAVDTQIASRQQDANAFTQQLITSFGPVPPVKKSRWPSLNAIMLVITALLAVAFLITLAVTLNEIAS